MKNENAKRENKKKFGIENSMNRISRFNSCPHRYLLSFSFSFLHFYITVTLDTFFIPVEFSRKISYTMGAMEKKISPREINNASRRYNVSGATRKKSAKAETRKEVNNMAAKKKVAKKKVAKKAVKKAVKKTVKKAVKKVAKKAVKKTVKKAAKKATKKAKK